MLQRLAGPAQSRRCLLHTCAQAWQLNYPALLSPSDCQHEKPAGQLSPSLIQSYLLRTLQEVLARLDLQHFFAARVTSEDGTETISQSLLSAAFKLQRPPNQCVVFDSSPAGVAAAHNCTMKVTHLLESNAPRCISAFSSPLASLLRTPAHDGACQRALAAYTLRTHVLARRAGTAPADWRAPPSHPWRSSFNMR